MTRSTTFKGLLAAIAAVALLIATTVTGATEQNEAESRNPQHRARARRMGRWVKLVESHSHCFKPAACTWWPYISRSRPLSTMWQRSSERSRRLTAPCCWLAIRTGAQ